MQKLSLLAILCTLSATSAFAGDLTVKVSGVAGATGQVGCGLHASGATFPMGQTPAQVWVPANPAGVTCRFEGVAPGAYAVAVSHDLNGNRKTDTNFLGMPTEAWGVSNNVRPGLRAPRFDEARFAVPAEGATISVRIAR